MNLRPTQNQNHKDHESSPASGTYVRRNQPARTFTIGTWRSTGSSRLSAKFVAIDKQFKYCKGPGGGDAANKTRLRASTFWEVLLKQVGEERANAYVEEAKRLKITIWSGRQHGVSYGHPPSTKYFVPPKVKEPASKKVHLAPGPTVSSDRGAARADLPNLPPSRAATPEPTFSANVREEFNYSYGDYADYFSAHPLTRFNPCPPVAVKMSDMV
ncbi:hypothetical protein BDN72DRAFT_879649 [Pluteus cervinus]|uniref:Uncharacterized protein n=1 Tax=Pluteus cervinus TaxID=181527 RepID=A0ACD3AP47_9AGAR|nr:hypothetical protein BDN72DRAFT_879649 [Pluteus cervinus]